MKSTRFAIGIDLGTSSVKLVLIDQEGKVLKTAGRKYSVTELQPGWREIDPALWFTGVEESLAELLAGVDAQAVTAIGVTGQMHTIILLDAKGEPVRPALMWNDTRTASMVPALREKIRALPQVSYIANIISTGSPATNLLWVKENEPENFAATKHFLIGPDYIAYRLTGQYQTDYCEASTSSMCDLHKGDWSTEIRELMGFPEEIYPPIRGTMETAGNLLPQWQAKYGLRPEVRVLVGTGDNPAAAIATGCFARKLPVLSFGTSGVLMFPRDEVSFQAKGKNILFSLDGQQRSVLVQGSIQSCGSTLGWWMEKVLLSDAYDEEIQAKEGGVPENLFFYPHLTGDKTIYADPSLRGCFLGLGTSTTRRDMTLAVLEGICFAVKQLAEAMEVPKEKLVNLPVIGGGSKNPIWMQLLADVLDTPVIQTESSAGAGYGMALAAMADSPQELSAMLEKLLVQKQRYLPDAERAARCQAKYQKYLRIYDALQILNQD